MLPRPSSFPSFVSSQLRLRSPGLLRDLQLQSLVRPKTPFSPTRPFSLFCLPFAVQKPFFPKTPLLHFAKLMQQGGGPTVDGASEEKGSILDGTGGVGSDSSSMGVAVSDHKYANLEADGTGIGAGAPVINSVGDASSDSGNAYGGRAARIRGNLERGLCPMELEVEDVSYQHAGHAAVRGNSNGETHFNVKIVSKEFEGKNLVKRHRLVYDLLQDELQSGLHALSIVAKTPSEVGRK